MSRLDGDAPSAAQATAGVPACLECGKSLEAMQRLSAAFCCTACRRAWNNRRMVRGAELFDLYMAQRYERGAAQAAQVMTLISRLAATYRAEDERDRDGRRSWQTIRAVLDRRPSLRAIVVRKVKPLKSQGRV